MTPAFPAAIETAERLDHPILREETRCERVGERYERYERAPLTRAAAASKTCPMRTAAALLAILAAGLLGAGAASASHVHAACGAGYVAASLPGGHKCLHAGEVCKVGYAAYRRYGFVCPITRHLRRR